MTQRQRLNKMVKQIFPAIHGGDGRRDLSHSGWQRLIPKTVLLCCGSVKGMSKLLFFCSGLAENGGIYSTKYLPEVASFTKKYHKAEDTVFWSDLETAHYSRRSIEEMERLNVDVVPKLVNPPNVPKLRFVEDFWQA
ncbi:uncharacterized protein LOC129732388 [Wyeomyia smithii]|uniref:uncharacterized protein LOC129732388 n=1 Tax=Wyeomyia smithii TaxID=174621 RepID=UPI002467F017|nr:uncharacterized protein LOC129732388 [Wyeomyia smithii]